MAEQSLDHDEQLNIRWAYDDPNPRAQAMRLRNNAQIVLAAMEAKGHLIQDADESAYPEESLVHEDDAGYEPDAKRLRSTAASNRDLAPMTREEHSQQLADAEAQLEAAAAAEAVEAAAQAEKLRELNAASEASRLDAILSKIDGGPSCVDKASVPDPLADFLASVAPAVAQQARDAEVVLPPGVWQPRMLPPGWREFSDPATGHPYYVDPAGESTWKHPVG